MKEIIETRKAPSPIGPYSQAVRAGGFIFVSGQIPIDPSTGNPAGASIADQARQVMKNLEAILGAAGSSFDQVVKTTVYLSKIGDFPEFNNVYGEYLGESKPARATVEVSRLPKDVLLQVDAIALA